MPQHVEYTHVLFAPRELCFSDTIMYIIMICAKYGFGPSEDFAAQTSDPSFAQ